MESLVHSNIAPRNVRPFNLKKEDVGQYEDLKALGIGFDEKTINKMIAGMGMDAIEPLVTTASISTPIQFLQNWLPGFVYVITAARNIDLLTGIMTTGSWEDEEVVQGVMELTGTSVPYGDYTNIPLSSWNTNYERRTVVRFEEGMQVGALENARSSRANVDSGASKRQSAALALEIRRNSVGFYGFNSGSGRTYGYLNDPALPAYSNVANGASGNPEWSTKTFLEITADIREALQSLRSQSGDTIDPRKVDICLAIASGSVEYLTVTSDFGISVEAWLKSTYPRVRVESAPELDSANGGANVFYLYAEQVENNGTDDGRTFIQVVPAKFQVLGVQQLPKAYVEDYSNATAGVMCKRPWAVVRRSGI